MELSKKTILGQVLLGIVKYCILTIAVILNKHCKKINLIQNCSLKLPWYEIYNKTKCIFIILYSGLQQILFSIPDLNAVSWLEHLHFTSDSLCCNERSSSLCYSLVVQYCRSGRLCAIMSLCFYIYPPEVNRVYVRTQSRTATVLTFWKSATLSLLWINTRAKT